MGSEPNNQLPNRHFIGGNKLPAMTTIEYDDHTNKFYYKETGEDLLDRIKDLITSYNGDNGNESYVRITIQRRGFVLGRRNN